MTDRTYKIIKICFLTVIALLLTSILVVSLKGKFHFDDYFNSRSEIIYKEEYKASDIKNIKVNTTSGDLEIIHSKDNKIKVEAYGKKKSDVKVTLSENTLDIDYPGKNICVGFCFYNNQIKVYVPNSYAGNFNIISTTGDILAGDFDKANYDISNTSGNVRLGNANNLKIISTSGDVTVQKTNILEASSLSGDIYAYNGNHVTAKTTSADIHLEEIFDYVNATSVSGDIRITKLNISENSKISSKSGDVIINDLNNVYVNTKTTSGDVHVDDNNRKAKEELEIKTISGDIYVR